MEDKIKLIQPELTMKKCKRHGC